VPLPSLSRRGFLGGAAGLAAVVALPQSGGSRAPAAVTPLTGATVFLGAFSGGNYLTNAQDLDGFIGLPLGTTIQKIINGTGSFPTTPGPHITQLAAVGCQFLVSVAPSLTMTSSERTAMVNYLTMLTNAGISYRVILFSEANDTAFTTQQEWQAYWSFYAPAIQAAGIPCAYCPGCNINSIARAEAFFPSNPTPDELWLDFYATAVREGVRIDRMIALAQGVGISVGLAEWGWHAGGSQLNPMTMPWWTLYCKYLTQLGDAKKLGLGAVYFTGAAASPRLNVIASTSDPRIPGIRSVCSAVQTVA
jgi:hypothetical protein